MRIMNREGIVTDIKGKYAKIDLVRHSACGDCGACSMGDENMQMSVESLNQVDASVGDRVEIEMQTDNVLTAAFIAYVIPLTTFVLGIVFGMKYLAVSGYSGNIEGAAAVIGLVLMFLTYGVIKLNDKKFKQSKKYLSVVIKVLQDDEIGPDCKQ